MKRKFGCGTKLLYLLNLTFATLMKFGLFESIFCIYFCISSHYQSIVELLA
jgi:hypothetical protein